MMKSYFMQTMHVSIIHIICFKFYTFNIFLFFVMIQSNLKWAKENETALNIVQHRFVKYILFISILSNHQQKATSTTIQGKDSKYTQQAQ